MKVFRSRHSVSDYTETCSARVKQNSLHEPAINSLFCWFLAHRPTSASHVLSLYCNVTVEVCTTILCQCGCTVDTKEQAAAPFFAPIITNKHQRYKQIIGTLFRSTFLSSIFTYCSVVAFAVFGLISRLFASCSLDISYQCNPRLLANWFIGQCTPRG